MIKNLLLFFVLIATLMTASVYAEIVINEIHYNPDGKSDDSEFIELWNNSNKSIDISGWTISDGVKYSFPAATFIPPNEFVVVARNPVMFIAEHPAVILVYGPFESDTKLSNSGEQIALSDDVGNIIIEVTYSDSYPWSEIADGGGPSLELKHPIMDLNEPYSWAASFLIGGTPGATNSVFLKDSLIFNTTRSPKSPDSFSNVFLTTEFSVGSPTNVTVKYSTNGIWQYKSLALAVEGVWTSSLPAQVDGIWVNYIVYAVHSNGMIYGGSPEFMETYRVMDEPIFKHSIIINEIMYNSSTSANYSSYEYVELFNTSSKTVDLAGCVFEDIRFPTNEFLLLPGKFAVITDQPDVMNSVYSPIENLINIDIGLSDNGETLRFKSPNEITISKVTYEITNDWPITSNGGGPSLELMNPYLDSSKAESWTASSGYGTPGTQNSNYSTGSFASLMNIKLDPSSPDIGEEVSVSVETLSSTNIISLMLEYQTNETDLMSVAMYDDGEHADTMPGDGIYSTIIPPIYNSTFVWYQFRMTLEDSTIIEFGEEVNLPDFQLTVRLSGDGLITKVIPSDQWQLAVTTGTSSSSTLYLYLDSKNEMLIDNISIKDLSGTEYIVNGSFDSNDSGWLKTGNHNDSVFYPFSGYLSSGCEKIISHDSGGSAGNSLNCYTSPSLRTDGTKYILSFAYRKSTVEWLNYYNGKREFNNLYINEIMPRNNSSLVDDNGAFSDWIELYNAGTNSIPLGGLYLTDDLADKNKWQIPIGITVGADDYIVFWADGEDTDKHTNFKLNSGGEAVGVFSPDKELIDSVVFGEQLADISFGRQWDGGNDWGFFSYSTPNSANDTQSNESLIRIPPPEFSIPGGFYTGNQSIELSVTSVSATIIFTLDGSIPTTNDFEYVTPINITTTTVVRAYSLGKNYLPSLIVTHTYFINESNSLPVVSVSTTPSLLWDDQTGIYKNDITDVEIPVNIEFYEPDGSKGFTIDAGMQIGGWNIFRYAQNPLNIYARNKYGYNFIEYQIFKNKYVSQFKKIVLRNGGDDWHDAMFRDPMMQYFAVGRMSNAIMEYRPSAVFLNGEYWGIHNIREKYDEQYFIANFELKAGEFDHVKYDLNTDKPAAEQGDLIHYNHTTEFISNNDMSDFDNYEYVKTLIDVNSFIDRTIMAIFTADTSWHHNDELWRQKSETGKWQWVIVDLDRGFNINNVSLNLLQNVMNKDEIFIHLIQNNEFKNNFIARFSSHLYSTFNETRVNQIIDKFKSGVAQEMPRHIAKWSSEGGIASMSSWENEIEELRDFQTARPANVVQHIKSMFGLGDTAKLFLSVSKPGGGQIFINDVSIPDNSFSGDFFLDIPLNLRFALTVGYNFIHWEEYQIGDSVTLLPRGSTWHYFDDGTDLSNAWFNTEFDDSGWSSGPAQLGYGDGDESTVVNYGTDSDNKHITTYFRTSFVVTNLDEYAGFFLRILRDDGVIIYINGQKIESSNMPETSDFMTLANSSVGDDDEDTFYESALSKRIFITGTNIIAAEIHQINPTSSDISFDLELVGLKSSSGTTNIISSTNNFSYNLANSVFISAVVSQTDDLILSSNIFENLTLSETGMPYLAQGDIIVHSNTTLKINTGVNIQIPESASIYVYGKLDINGNVNNPVIISPNISYNANKWGAICFVDATGTSTISHVRLEGATHGADSVKYPSAVSAYNSSIVLDNVQISADFPVTAKYGETIIRNCIFRSEITCDLIHITSGKALIENCDLGVNYAMDTDAIDFDNVYNGIILSNQIHDFFGVNSDGIDIGESSSNIMISRNVIRNCSDKGVSIGQQSSASLIYNVIRNCTHGIGIKDSGSFATIDRNTFYQNIISIACYEKNIGKGGGNAKIINTILSLSAAASFMTDNVSSIELSYSLSDRDYLPGKSNLFADPLFFNPGVFDMTLNSDSPCIDAGDPLSFLDPDGTSADIGAYYYDIPEPCLFFIYQLLFFIYCLKKTV